MGSPDRAVLDELRPAAIAPKVGPTNDPLASSFWNIELLEGSVGEEEWSFKLLK